LIQQSFLLTLYWALELIFKKVLGGKNATSYFTRTTDLYNRRCGGYSK